MKRGGWIKRKTPLKSGTRRLRVKGVSDTSTTKDEIQDLVRAIVIKRDGGCVLRNLQHVVGACGSKQTKDGHMVLQADHLVTRANNATFGDTRLIVCLCQSHHGGFKQWNKADYDKVMRGVIGPKRTDLWDKAEADRHKIYPMHSSDWKLLKIALEQELRAYS